MGRYNEDTVTLKGTVAAGDGHPHALIIFDERWWRKTTRWTAEMGAAADQTVRLEHRR